MALETKLLYEFAGFRFDPAQQLLLRDGKPVSLTPKTFELLLVLLQSNGRLLSKDELMRKLWPDSFVEDANLTVNISALRKALGDPHDGEGRELIETVPKRGYRFLPTVTELLEESESSTGTRAPAVRLAMTPPEPVADERESHLKSPELAAPKFPRLIAALLVLVGILIAALTYAWYQQRTISKLPAETHRRLAILPFQNLRHDPDSDFLGYSLADAVITKLGYVQALRVRPSYAVAKYRDQTIDIPKTAAELNVDTLLMGNFIRDGDALRITCQLVDAGTDNILWKGAFEVKVENLLTVHDRVAQEIIKGLELNLSPSEAEQLKPEQPVDPIAYEYYLRGVDLYSRDMFPLAVKMFEKSAEITPSYALTWAYLGRSYNASASFEFGGREHYQKAQAAFEKALTLQPALIDARVYLANFYTDTGRVEQSVPLLREALKTNPDHAEVHWELGYAYRFAGMLKESAAECERARSLDPLVKLNSSALNAYLYLGQYDKFLESLPKTNESAFIFFYRGFAEYYKKDWPAATRDFDRAYELDPSLLQAQVGKALSYGIASQRPKGLEILRDAEDKVKERGVGDSEAIFKIGQAYAVLGDRVSATRVLAISIDKGFFAYPYFVVDPLLNSLHDEPEFAQLMKTAQARHDSFRKSFF
ncbi:MAG: winged helix-turn-helix domain-containing protein [Acidobacteria bacterium]|nr:winged helix-turn-helix domain-containing protein [Acidobacteriota bacterium]